MDMPPSRYKVVEKGRRLVVVDTYTGEAVRPTPARREPQRPASMGPNSRIPASSGPLPEAGRPRPSSADRTFTTRPWYDNKAPRTLALTDEANTVLIFVGGGLLMIALVGFFFFQFVGLVVAAVILGQKGVRAALRRGATSWLDSLPQP